MSDVIGKGSKILPVNLPLAFKEFEKTKDVVIDLKNGSSLTFTFQLATSFDTTWASTEASANTLDLSAMGASYIPKILASTLLKLNDKDLMHYVPAKLQAVRENLNPNERSFLTEERRGLVSQWIYEAIVSRIPLELLTHIYNEELEEWFSSAGGLVDLPDLDDDDERPIKQVTQVVNKLPAPQEPAAPQEEPQNASNIE
ncbi:hypothetical protein, partial [Ewingella americana]|uniref:Uncharacterized protein n=1 Tax=Ewingella americana TaxID=41202 RepID=A0A502GD07_9GAMM